MVNFKKNKNIYFSVFVFILFLVGFLLVLIQLYLISSPPPSSTPYKTMFNHPSVKDIDHNGTGIALPASLFETNTSTAIKS